MNDSERIGDVYTGIRRADHPRSLRALGGYISSPGGSSPDASSQPATPETPQYRAFLQRERVCGVIEQGLTNHPSRLDARQWQRVKDELRLFDPGCRGAKVTVLQSIELTRTTFRERRGSYGYWNVTEAARFEVWAKDLIAALEQYQRSCDEVSRA